MRTLCLLQIAKLITIVYHIFQVSWFIMCGQFASIRADCGSGIGRITKNLLIRYFNEAENNNTILWSGLLWLINGSEKQRGDGGVLVVHDNSEKYKQGELIVSAEETISIEQSIEEEDFSKALAVIYTGKILLLHKLLTVHLAAKASSWHGVDIKGCKKESYALLMKLDQRREREMKQGEGSKANRNNIIFSKEVRNLFFDMNFKDGEPRSTVRALTIVIRRTLSHELKDTRDSFNGTWVVCGDFNITSFPSERTNCTRISGVMTEFSSCIEESELIKQISLIRLASDHNPILLTCGNWDWKKTYFKFETWWLEVDGFKDKVKELWESLRVKGRTGYVLAKKFKMLKATIKEWSKYNRGNWKQKKDDILNQISYQETVREQRPLTDDELVQKANLTLEFEERFNSMEQLKVNVNDTIIQDPENIKEAETGSWRPDFIVHEAARITDVEHGWLQRAFEEKEIVECLNMCAVDKASGPDGFPMVLYQTFWSLLKEDVTNTIQYFHSNQVKCFNALFIA
ncbi:hypothetical protein H5410_005342 [Solanum commersonii]|uniref:Endonuclease/exonuclease/phosphatase domain-containing protein n=1 Tax=Solanum commersonii TaxID=4109 RepID=A0A9J6A7B0_SOLCO|nr:hypothetical protein H5410_005342 [Solanum commersonii]